MSFLCHNVSETGIDTVSENLLSGASVKYGKNRGGPLSSACRGSEGVVGSSLHKCQGGVGPDQLGGMT